LEFYSDDILKILDAILLYQSLHSN